MAEHHDKWVHNNLKLDPATVKSLAERLPRQVDSYLQTWVNAASDAGTEMPQTSDRTQAVNFGLALAGNLAWAATCLTPQGAAITIALSFAGAAVGSGTFSGSDPYPIKEIHDQVYLARDKLSAAFHASARTMATAIVAAGTTGPEAQDQAIWRLLFKDVPFDSASTLLAKARAAIKQAFATFSDQYESWEKVTYDQAADLNENRMPLPQVSPAMLAKVGYVPALQARLPGVLAQVRAKHPFRLKLHI